jgi:hypothetical protein
MPKKHRRGRAAPIGLCLALFAAACNSEDPGNNMMMPEPEKPFEPVPPAVYVAKVKNLLTGQAPTDAELQMVTADPKALATLIEQWQTTPQYEDKLLDYFKQAFQQTQINRENITDVLGGEAIDGDTPVINKLIKSMQESFARTALEIVKQGKPFHETITTQTYQMNVPLMVFYGYLDSRYRNDTRTGSIVSRVAALPNFKYQYTTNMVPLSATLTPGNANYLVWQRPTAYTGTDPICQQATSPSTTGVNGERFLYTFIMGRVNAQGSNGCGATGGGNGLFTAAEWDTWKPVTIRTPNTGEQPTNFFDLLKLRSTNEMVLESPRAGFFTTPAFIANWPTNASNQHRVSINQMMIVALGKSFDDSTINNDPAIDQEPDDAKHANPTTVCWSCHRNLDPMRQFLRQSFTFTWHLQKDMNEITTPAKFIFGTTNQGGQGIGDLTKIMASHDRFAYAWAQKLCFYANSTACSDDDPEFLRIIDVFKQSNFNYKTLVREIFSSPLVTLASRTKTFTDNEQPIGISRREHLCSALSTRLGLTDICALNTLTPTGVQASVSTISLSIPIASYSRGNEAPITSRDPNMFFRASTENVCRLIADQVVDNATNMKYSSTMPDVAIADFVGTVMAVPPSHPQAAAAKQILTEHFNNAKMTMGVTARDALKSTFVLACSSPTSVSIGL